MKVQELREALKDLPDDMEIILQKDQEGNGYERLRCVDPEGIYLLEEVGEDTVYDAKWTAEEADMSEEDWEEMKKLPRVLVLTP